MSARLPASRAAILLVLIISAVSMPGCIAGLAVMQAIPAAMGGVAIANVESRDPFVTHAPYAPPRDEAALRALDARILAAECGDPQAQYWLAGALGNGFNANPDRIEMRKWLQLAQRGGVAAATPELARLDATLSAQQIAVAQARADGWLPPLTGCAGG